MSSETTSPEQITITTIPSSPRKEDFLTGKDGQNPTFYKRKGNMVWRLFYDDSTFAKDRRYRCIAYSHNENDGLTEYGASVFKLDEGKIFNKKTIRRELNHTARKRFEKCPVRVVMAEVKDRADLQKRLTKALYRYGSRSKRDEKSVEEADKLIIHGKM